MTEQEKNFIPRPEDTDFESLQSSNGAQSETSQITAGFIEPVFRPIRNQDIEDEIQQALADFVSEIAPERAAEAEEIRRRNLDLLRNGGIPPAAPPQPIIPDRRSFDFDPFDDGDLGEIRLSSNINRFDPLFRGRRINPFREDVLTSASGQELIQEIQRTPQILFNRFDPNTPVEPTGYQFGPKTLDIPEGRPTTLGEVRRRLNIAEALLPASAYVTEDIATPAYQTKEAYRAILGEEKQGRVLFPQRVAMLKLTDRTKKLGKIVGTNFTLDFFPETQYQFTGTIDVRSRDMIEVPGKGSDYTNTDTGALLFESLNQELSQNPRKFDELLEKVDTHVTSNSDALKQEIQERDLFDENIVEYDVVIVGSSFTAAQLAAIYNGHSRVLVISQDKQLSQTWRNRALYLNSTVDISDFDAPNLPFAGGSSTPITPYGDRSLLNPSYFTQYSYEVLCDDGNTRKYPDGQMMGRVNAVNLAITADDFLMETSVDPSDSYATDEGIFMEATDDVTGAFYKIKAKEVFYATGPGKEKIVFESEVAQRNIAQEFTRTQEALQKVEETQSFNGFETPRIFNLSQYEKIVALYKYYNPETYEEFAMDNPFAGVFRKDARVCIIGDKDSASIGREIFGGITPGRIYPGSDQRNTEVPQVTQYNMTPEKLEKLRRRYQEATQNLTLNPNKVKSVFRTADNTVIVIDEEGNEQEYDYVFMATGFQAETNIITDEAIYRDDDGNPIAKQVLSFGSSAIFPRLGQKPGDQRKVGLKVGSACRFSGEQLPEAIGDYLRAIGISENTLALWALQPIIMRTAYDVLRKKPEIFNPQKVEEVFAAVV